MSAPFGQKTSQQIFFPGKSLSQSALRSYLLQLHAKNRNISHIYFLKLKKLYFEPISGNFWLLTPEQDLLKILAPF